MTIRKATPNDLPAVVALARQMADYHHQLDPYYKTSAAYKNLEGDFAEELEDKDSLILVAEIDGRVTGYFRGMIEPAPLYVAAKKVGVVNDLFVEPAGRKKGAGGKLFQAALDWFGDRGVKNIELNVDARNTLGIAFWKKHGFFDYKIRMRKDFGPGK